MPEKITLWLDCDTGHDDAFALLLAAHHPSLHLLGVSTVYGNAPLSHTTQNTLAILTAIHRPSIPVYPGAAHPFCRPAVSAPEIHGQTGLDGTTCLPAPTCSAVRTEPPTTAVEAMYVALIAQPPGTAWLVATGCLTNIALLFALHSDLATHLAGLSIMGGAIGGGFTNAPLGTVSGPQTEDSGSFERIGNYTPWAEFNIWLDPESARAVFSNPDLNTKTTLVGLDLTHQFLATLDVQALLLHGGARGAGSPPAPADDDSSKKISSVRRLFYEIITFFAATYASVFGLTAGPPTHDPLAVAAIVCPELFIDNGGERFTIDVVTEGEQCGRTVAKPAAVGKGGVRVPRGLDQDQLWQMLEACLAKVEQTTTSS